MDRNLSYIVENSIGKFLENNRWKKHHTTKTFTGTYGDPTVFLSALKKSIKKSGVTIKYGDRYFVEEDEPFDHEEEAHWDPSLKSIRMRSNLKSANKRSRRFAVLVHEYVHYMVGWRKYIRNIPKEECIADIVAYVVSDICGVRHHDAITYARYHKFTKNRLGIYYPHIEKLSKQIIRKIVRNL